MNKFDEKLFDELIRISRIAERKRAHHIFNKNPDDQLQSIYVAMQPGTYVQPHKHESPDKREIFIAFKGKFLFLEFDTQGEIIDHLILDPKTNTFSAEIDSKIYHTLICLEPDSVGLDLKTGPFHPINDKDFADWALKEGDKECDEYIDNILNKLNIQIS